MLNNKKKRIIFLIAGIVIFLVSYNIDSDASIFFKAFKSPLLDFVLSIITNFGVVIIVMLAIPSIMLFRKNRKAANFLFLAFISAIILAFIIKLIVSRQRPMEIFAHPNIGVINYPILSVLYYSFPSMHAMVVFALLPVLLKYLPNLKYFWVIFAFLIAFTRIYLGFHFLSDVVFGALVGCFIGDFLMELYEKGKLWKK